MKYLKAFLFTIISSLIISCDSSLLSNIKEKGKSIFSDAKDFNESVIDNLVEKGTDIYQKVVTKIGDTYDVIAPKVVYMYEEGKAKTTEIYEKAYDKVDSLIGDAKEYINGLGEFEKKNETYSSYNDDQVIKDEISDNNFSSESYTRYVNDNNDLDKFITYYLSSQLASLGYTVLKGVAYYKKEYVSGLIFTNYTPFIEEDNGTAYSCGFLQLVGEDYSGILLEENKVNSGIIAVSMFNENETNQAFVVDEYADLDSFSGIYKNKFFTYEQENGFVLRIKEASSIPNNYDKTINLYNFDTDEYIYYNEPTEEEKALLKLYQESPENYSGAVNTVNALVDYEEQEEEVSSVAFISKENLENIVNECKEKGSDMLTYLQSKYESSALKDNQYFCITDNGVKVLGNEYEIDKERTTNGIIQTVASALGTASAVISIAFGVYAGSTAVKAIIITTGVMAVVYNVSNLIEGVQDVKYGVEDSSETSTNPVLSLFEKVIKDEDTAKLIYHIWGVGSTFISGIMSSIGRSLSICAKNGYGAFRTSVSVIRASIVKIGKLLVSGVGAEIAMNYVSKVCYRVTNDESVSRLMGFGSALVSSFIIYGTLENIDKKVNISGVYPKENLESAYLIELANKNKNLLKDNSIKDLSKGEKEELVYNLVEVAKDRYEVVTPLAIKVIYDSNNVASGSYNNENNEITINLSSLDNTTLAGLANTIGHEVYHAYQYNLVEPNWMLDCSLKNYVAPLSDGSNYDDYRYQTCEVEAFNKGKEFENYVLSLS